MRRFVLLLLCVAAALAAIAGVFDRGLAAQPRESAVEITDEVEAQVEGTIRLYNKIYQDFFATGGDPKLIDHLPASVEVRHFTYRDLGYLQDSGLVLVHDLADLEVLEIRPGERGWIEAKVREEWNYMYQSAEDRTPLSDLAGMTFAVTYRLEATEDGWIVTGWEPEAG